LKPISSSWTASIALLPGENPARFSRQYRSHAGRAGDRSRYVADGGFRRSGDSTQHFLDIDLDGFGPYPFAGLARMITTRRSQKFGVSPASSQMGAPAVGTCRVLRQSAARVGALPDARARSGATTSSSSPPG
jgi:hypothetical protein